MRIFGLRMSLKSSHCIKQCSPCKSPKSPKVNNLKIILIIFLFIGGAVMPAVAQERLSKKDRKKSLSDTRATRLFIDGQRFLMQEDFDRAHFYFQKALEISPDEPAINFKIAEILLRADRVDQALEYGLKAVDLDPENKYYNLVMAEAFSKNGEPAKAAEILENLTSKSEENQNYILDLASLYLTAGDFDKALIAINRAEEYYGVVEQLTLQKQRIYLRKNDLESTIKEGQKLIEAHPGNSQYVLSLVEILFNNGRIDEAIDLVETSLKSYPNQPDLNLAAYALYKDKGEVQLAENMIKLAFANPDLEGQVKAEAFTDVLREMQTERRDSLLDNLEQELQTHHEANAEVLAALGNRKLMVGERNIALDYYKKSIDLNPNNADVLQNIISTLFENPDDFEVIEKYTDIAVDEFPERSEFWFFDGTAKLALKKGEAAETSLVKAAELNKAKNKQLEILIKGQLGDTYHMLGKKEKAYAAYEDVLKESPEDEHVLNNYAYFLSIAKVSLEKAKKMSEQLVKRHPKNSTYLDTHAWVLFQLKEYESAKNYMQKALEAEETPSGIMLEHYGDILYHLGNRNEAISYWKKAEGSDETSELLYKKIKDQKYYD